MTTWRLSRALIIASLALIVAACASIGRPEGGPRDAVPPMFVKASPAPSAINVSGNKIVIEFDENVQLDNPMDKVVVSPAQRANPHLSANGRRVTVELRDTLLPNTTYTIDFADAIKDLNEGNILDGFAIDFSTGPQIDTLRISGMVFEASNLEPAQGMLVGAYLDRGDTAITTLPFDRITKTNQLGQFTLRNLKPGRYAVYALGDNNRDFKWDRTENIAFIDSLIVPYTEPGDTANPVKYLPNDLLLTWFNEGYQAQYLKEYSRPADRQLSFTLGAPTDTLPLFRMLNGPRAGLSIDRWAKLTANEGLDSLTYWIADTLVAAQDSILLEATYQRVDSADRLVWKTDTLKLNLRRAQKKEDKNKKAAEADTLPTPTPMMDLKPQSAPVVDLNKPLLLIPATPVASIDTAGIRMEMLVDTLWTAAEPPRFAAATLHRSDTITSSILSLRAPYKWIPGAKYRLTVDSTAVTDIYGLHNNAIKYEFSARAAEEYSALFFNITGLPAGTAAVVQLLNGQDTPVAQAPVDGSQAALEYLTPGTYYARLFIDANGNGRWDTGSLLDSVQPEEVYYYPKALKLKKNWDVEQSWNILETPVDMQKPVAIKKNKPKLQPGQQPEKTPDEDEEENDPFGANPYNPADPYSRSQRGGFGQPTSPQRLR